MPKLIKPSNCFFIRIDDNNADVISKRRRRNEICMSLKRSSIIHNTYVLKNIAQMLILLAYIPVNIFFAIDAEKNLEPSVCVLEVPAFPSVGIPAPGELHFQCAGKKVHFLLRLLYIQTGSLVMVLACSIGSIVWCVRFRSISRLLDRFRAEKGAEPLLGEDDGAVLGSEKHPGQDFLFLFDLLAHTAGTEATLRVLTHADETFRQICLPRLRLPVAVHHEDRLQVSWRPAPLELWLRSHKHKGIAVDSYVSTIFPADTSNNSVTKAVQGEADKDYTAGFYDLQGGKTEYVVTVACVIGQSRMKGARVVTTLLPHGPELPPRTGLVRNVSTNQVEISWDPPKGGFTKYLLTVDPDVVSSLKPSSTLAGQLYLQLGSTNAGSSCSLGRMDSALQTRELSALLTNHTVAGLSPGEAYGLRLATLTGARITKQPLWEAVVTKPLPPSAVQVERVTQDLVVASWLGPARHSRLRGYELSVRTIEASAHYKPYKVHCVRRGPGGEEGEVNSWEVAGLPACTHFSLTLQSVVLFGSLPQQSSEAVTVHFCSLPAAPTGLVLESRFPNSLTVRWEPPVPALPGPSARFRLGIEAGELGYQAEYSVPATQTTFNFSKLPELAGAGAGYTVRVESCAVPVGGETETTSTPLMAQFTTRPLAPANLKTGPGGREVSWTRSPSPRVAAYRVRCKPVEEGARVQEHIVTSQDQPDTHVCYIMLEVNLSVGLARQLFMLYLFTGSSARHCVQTEYLRFSVRPQERASRVEGAAWKGESFECDVVRCTLHGDR